MTTIKLTSEQAEDLLDYYDGMIHVAGMDLARVVASTETADEYRWATIHRWIFRDNSTGEYWAFDHEYSHTEMAEPWSYIQPELKKAKPVDRVVRVYELDAGS